ncbi:MAG TPA: hypothetical protein VHF58_09540, partial [Solirubrobacterales bacterium]|nr:hypothetical protein [Solirubrobacterales bacterium]
MSQENVEIYKRAIDAFDRGDRDTWVAIHHEECELIPSATWPEADIVRGGDANWEFYTRVTEPFAHHAY